MTSGKPGQSRDGPQDASGRVVMMLFVRVVRHGAERNLSVAGELSTGTIGRDASRHDVSSQLSLVIGFPDYSII